MIHLKKYKLFEKSIINNLVNVIKNIMSGKFKDDEIKNHIGIDKDEYEIGFYDEDTLSMYINSEILEDIMGVEYGSLFYILRLSYISNYDDSYRIEEDELYYINRYISEETFKKIKKLAKLFKYKGKLNLEKDGDIHELFNYLSLNDSILYDARLEIESENVDNLTSYINEILKGVPFEMEQHFPNYRSNIDKRDMELTFKYENILNYFKKEKLENINTIKDLIKSVDSSEISMELEYYSNWNSDADYTRVDKVISDGIENLLDFPDEIFQHFVDDDNITLLKKFQYLAEFDTTYSGREYLFQKAKNSQNCLKYFKSYKFQKWLMKLNEEDEKFFYKLLQKIDIINDKIDDEYSYIDDSERFGL